MQNVGSFDRIARTLAATMMIVAGLLAPLPMVARGMLSGMGVYLLMTAATGTCLGYRLMGRSSCPVHPVHRHDAHS